MIVGRISRSAGNQGRGRGAACPCRATEDPLMTAMIMPIVHS